MTVTWAASVEPLATPGATIVGQLTVPDDVRPIARRPDVRGLGMPRPRAETTRRRGVVYLETTATDLPASASRPSATIDQRNETFVPHLVAIQAGTAVDFPNNDETYHNVFSLSPERSFDLGRYAAGRTRSVRFDQPGIIRVFCDIHSHMSAYVLVFDHRFFAVTDDDGRFTLSGVPPGEYTIVAWHELFDTQSRTIDIAEGQRDVRVDFVFE